jgi:aminocarboxymuconate-semialdehyde decarboxylase
LVRDNQGNECFDYDGQFRTRPPFRALVDVPARLAAMDAAGLRRQAISPWMDMSGYLLNSADGEGYSALLNGTIQNLVRQHPDRFVGLCTVPLQDGGRAARELERCLDSGAFKGVEIGTNVAGRNLDDPALDPFWSAAESTGAFIFIHPFNTLETVTPRLREYYFSNLIGNPLDTALAAGCLMFGGVLERFPGLKICLAHGGGHLPYQVGRLQHGFLVRPEAKVHTQRPPYEFFSRFYFDTLLHSQASLEFLVGLVGADRLCIGTDYPFDMGTTEPVQAVESLPGLSREQRDRILFKNAERLLGLSGS